MTMRIHAERACEQRFLSPSSSCGSEAFIRLDGATQRRHVATRKARENAGYPRQELSHATALNPQTIYRLELGLRRMRRSTLLVLAKVLAENPEGLAEELVQLAVVSGLLRAHPAGAADAASALVGADARTGLGDFV